MDTKAVTRIYEVFRDHGLLNDTFQVQSMVDIPTIKSNLMDNSSFQARRGGLYLAGVVPGIIFDQLNRELEVPNGCLQKAKTGNGEFLFYGPGLHWLTHKDYFTDLLEEINFGDEAMHVEHGTHTVATIPKGMAGFADDMGQPIILPEGMHYWNSPTMKFFKIIPIDQHVVELGPMTLVTIDEGYCAVTQDNGAQKILEGGMIHLLTHRNWKFQKFIPLKQENLELGEINACTRDFITIHLHATVTWKIVDPAKACFYGVQTMRPDGSSVQGEDIEKIREDVKMQSIASLVNAIGNSNYISRKFDDLDAREDTWLSKQRIDAAIDHVNEWVKMYGVEVITIGILDINIGSRMVEDALAELSLTAIYSKSAIKEAQGIAQQIRIEGQARRQALVIEAQGHLAAAEELSKTSSGSDLAYELARVEAAGNWFNPQKHKILFGDCEQAEETRKLLYPDMMTAVMNNPTIVYDEKKTQKKIIKQLKKRDSRGSASSYDSALFVQ